MQGTRAGREPLRPALTLAAARINASEARVDASRGKVEYRRRRRVSNLPNAHTSRHPFARIRPPDQPFPRTASTDLPGNAWDLSRQALQTRNFVPDPKGARRRTRRCRRPRRLFLRMRSTRPFRSAHQHSTVAPSQPIRRRRRRRHRHRRADRPDERRRLGERPLPPDDRAPSRDRPRRRRPVARPPRPAESLRDDPDRRRSRALDAAEARGRGGEHRSRPTSRHPDSTSAS